jgi:3-hydroxyacyl-[acyl-carrier protein] dehydratase/trans-2-decenoyl-[acyl-carrier protein] isomerase
VNIIDEINIDETIYLNKKDIAEIESKTHYSQDFIREMDGDSSEDVYALPVPYMAALHSAKLCYKKGTGKYGKGYAEGELKLTQEDPWFWCHFLGDPVMPGSQGTDGFLQLAGCWGGATGKVSGRVRALAGNFEYMGQVLPINKKIFYRLEIVRFLKKKKLIFFEGHMAVDTPDNIIYNFTDCKVGYFSTQELSIPSGGTKEYYKPDWDLVKKRMLDSIEKSQKYYESRK